jgi:hypothetical protein
MKLRKSSVFSAALLLVLPLVNAKAFGQTANQLAPNRLATNLPGATTAVAPPDGFNPVEASDDELSMYGFPPRPNADLEPKAYATWAKAMAASKIRVFPQLAQTNHFAGPTRPAVPNKAVPHDSAAGTSNSYNWSGIVDFSGATSYNSNTSFYVILGQWVVPVAEQAYGACTGAWDYSVSWVGIDGWGSPDVLQAGTQSDGYCSGSTKSTYYSFWYEWFPNSWTNVTNLPVSAGDNVFVEIWNTSSTQGYAYMVNFQTNQSATVGFSAPAGTTLVGNSAEWIVERPEINGSLATLTNYIGDYFSDCYARTENWTLYDPGSPSAVSVTMLDNSGNPISYPNGPTLGSTAIWFQDENSALNVSLP